MAPRPTLTVSTTASSGTPNTWPAASTVSTCVIITVKGKVKRTVVPRCRWLDTATRPPSRSIVFARRPCRRRGPTGR